MHIEQLNKFYSDFELLKQFVIQRANIAIVKKYNLKYLPIFYNISILPNGNWSVWYYLMNSISEEKYFVEIDRYLLTYDEDIFKAVYWG